MRTQKTYFHGYCLNCGFWGHRIRDHDWLYTKHFNAMKDMANRKPDNQEKKIDPSTMTRGRSRDRRGRGSDRGGRGRGRDRGQSNNQQ